MTGIDLVKGRFDYDALCYNVKNDVISLCLKHHLFSSSVHRNLNGCVRQVGPFQSVYILISYKF